MNNLKSIEDIFILNAIHLGAKIKIKYQAQNDRMNDLVDYIIVERENWHQDFSQVMKELAQMSAQVALIDVSSDDLVHIRIQKLAFEGLMCAAEISVKRLGLNNPILVRVPPFSVDAELVRQVREEAWLYIFQQKRRAGEQLSLMGSFFQPLALEAH